MKTAAELQLRKVALVLTAVVGLQVLWSGARLVFMAEPAAIVPAAASLQVEGIEYRGPLEEEPPLGLVSRPLFWPGRQPYIPPDGAPLENLPVRAGDTSIDKVQLLGVYNGGANPGIIVAHEGERRRLVLNEFLGDWELAALTPDGALFENGRDSRILSLTHANGAPTARRVVPGRRAAVRNRQSPVRQSGGTQAAAEAQKSAAALRKLEKAQDRKNRVDKKKKKGSGKKKDKGKNAGNNDENTGD